MSLLLDTHVALWYFADDARIGRAREAIDMADAVYVSSASAWEVAIKVGLGKLQLPGPLSDGVARSGFVELPVRFVHAEATRALPDHHRDPFDRLLVAQTLIEGLTLVTHDVALARYAVPILWV